MLIKDSVYLITGGASGLGKAVAEKLLEEGASVTILDVQTLPENDSLQSYGDRILALQVDITSEEGVTNAVDATKRKFGKLTGVINCAGISRAMPVYNFENKEIHSLQDFTTMVNVNLTGLFNVIRLSVPHILENDRNENNERGIIINTSSSAGVEGRPLLTAYSASKAGVIGMTNSLAQELNPHGIRIVTIAPSAFNTPLFHSMAKQLPSSRWEPPPGPVSVRPRPGEPSDYADFVKEVITNRFLNRTTFHLLGGV